MDNKLKSDEAEEAQENKLPFPVTGFKQRLVSRRELTPVTKVKLEKKTRKRKVQPDDLIRRAVMGLAKMGKTYSEIADFVGVSKAFLHKNYADDIRSAKEIANALVVENLYAQAMKDSPSSIQAGIYITKARMGWNDKHEEKEQAPAVVFDFTGLDYDERLRLMEKIKIKQGAKSDNNHKTIDGDAVENE
jgi:hypothetical protein